MKNSIYFTGIPYRSSCFFNCIFFSFILFDILSIFELCPSCCALQGIIYFIIIIFFIFDIYYMFLLCCVFLSVFLSL
jgi:hypothetical protein